MGKDQISKMNMNQYLVLGRENPKEGLAEPPVFQMRVFAPNTVIAKSKFWYFLKRQKKIKRSVGEIIGIHQIFEKNENSIKNYGLVIRYQSRSGYHNMYKEYRANSVCEAVSQMYMEMSGRHRAAHDTIHIVRTTILRKNEEIQRAHTKIYKKNNLKFPLISKVRRAPIRKFKTLYKASRPNLFRQ